MGKKDWMVPMKFTGTGTAYVTAATAEEAARKAARGEWEGFEDGETDNYEVDGSAELNE